MLVSRSLKCVIAKFFKTTRAKVIAVFEKNIFEVIKLEVAKYKNSFIYKIGYKLDIKSKKKC